MALTLDTAPTVEPVTVAEAKNHLRVDTSAEDTLIGRLITAARRTIELWEWRSHITQTWKAEADDFGAIIDGCNEIRLPRPRLQSVTSIKYIDTNGVEQTLVKNTDYEVDAASEPGRISLVDGESWPVVDKTQHAVEFLYKAGYGDNGSDVPELTRSAILLFVEHLYTHRGTAGDVPAAIEPLLRPCHDLRTLVFL